MIIDVRGMALEEALTRSRAEWGKRDFILRDRLTAYKKRPEVISTTKEIINQINYLLVTGNPETVDPNIYSSLLISLLGHGVERRHLPEAIVPVGTSQDFLDYWQYCGNTVSSDFAGTLSLYENGTRIGTLSRWHVGDDVVNFFLPFKLMPGYRFYTRQDENNRLYMRVPYGTV